MNKESDQYSNFVEHPRYGREPRITGNNPETEYGEKTFLHWHSPKECRIPNTSVKAKKKGANLTFTLNAISPRD